ncbi:MAG: MBOAT family protein [Acidobacteriota bacterium]
MVFTSQIFVFYFLPAALLGYYLLGLPALGGSRVDSSRARGVFLVVASYVFYGWWNPAFVLLMLGSTLIDFRCGRIIAGRPSGDPWRKRALIASVAVNLSLLGFFKYWTLLAETLNGVFGTFLSAGSGHGELLPVLSVALPVGISFYTFQSMSYSIDLYRGDAREARDFADFAAYVSLFPQLVAGPIIRYRDLAEQLRQRSHTIEKLARGFSYFALGFAKKILLANNVGLLADDIFAAAAPPWYLAWIGVVAYAFQIYFDFSGYSDMAIGLGLMLGFRFPENFRSPYRARSITEFWRRWHISLSTWLRDYLYIPLGGNRRGRLRTYVNLGLTMLLGGLWHGAQWQFVVWGGYHGLLLALERALGTGKSGSSRAAPRALGAARTAFTFVLVLIGWVFFRAESLPQAATYLGCMFGLVPPTAGSTVAWGFASGDFGVAILLVCALTTWILPRTQIWVSRAWDDAGGPWRTEALRLGTVLLFALSLLEMSVQSHNPFLYFQF